MTTVADRVVQIASAELNNHVQEVPLGSNTGPRVIEYQATCSYAETQKTNWPWCDAFYRWVMIQAGLPDEDNCGSASTAATCRLAAAKGFLQDTPAIGAGIIWCGTHIGIVVGIGNGVVYTIEGNSGDAVTAHTRSIAGVKFVVPKSLGTVLVPPRLYWIDDDAAKFVIVGPWGKEAYAQKAFDKLDPAWQRRSEILHRGDGKWIMRMGDKPRRGPFLDPAKRDEVMHKLEDALGRKLGRKLIPRSTVSDLPPSEPAPVVTGSGSPDSLGKTT